MPVDFSYAPSTPRGRVRMYLRDHRPDSYAFTDTEIDVFLEIGGSWQGAVAEAATALLADRARFGRVYSVSEDGRSRSDDELQGIQYLQDLIDRFGGGGALPRAVVTYPGPHPSDPRRWEGT